MTTRPWAALSALCIGFFMIMLDTTIVSVAIPRLLTDLPASINEVVWVNSVYLLTYAVPLLLTGRLGDRFGPKRVFLAGLVVFTLASLWCGLSGSPEMLITARAVQGLGAAMMTPQTMAFITNLFKPSERGAPMGMWGAVAGVATLLGPLLGGVLVQGVGWEWIFIVNVPIGVVAIILTVWLVPDWQPKNSHRFDVPGILLCCLGLFALVFGIQNGQQYDWGTIAGPLSIPVMIAIGVLLLVAFVWWQARNRNEPLLPLTLFRSRTFSFANLANLMLGFTITGMFLPLVIWIQAVRGYSPIESGLLTAPMSLLSGFVAPFAGRLSDRINPKHVVVVGLGALAVGLAIIAIQTQPDTAPWALIPAFLVCGFGIGCVFSPLSNAATSALEPRFIGAGSGIFNTSRQVGGVLGSASIGVLLQARLAVELHNAAQLHASALPANERAGFVEQMTESAGHATEFGSSAPKGGMAPELAKAALDTFHDGFTSAAKATLVLPIVTLVIGAVFAAGMGKQKATPAAPKPETAPTPA
ncbi:DHA2 family efflux MFS transporter permease subunit [Labedaea rhizosphaerae]|uniref:EmrB/QacA subfamily drug resistance transporter n=1 Tax=Labedaea rhizosphaerae TaxID=598644 RepID=A0A4R6S277_LABRH|nr:DHA2 family efflux MFS transporter permease subunit [Labedaea rhizosphaerae]TDP93651.1 EmrB/QacA subfamily drug resistance transporter [Labedaea rhizosphaerae]